jgi:hypothetical protein
MPFVGLALAAFLAARAVPTGGFAVALAGGVALARVAQRAGLKLGWCASLAATLQAIAIMGPSRVGIPLTQAVSAPVLGRMVAKGRGPVAQALVAGAFRGSHNTLSTVFYVWVILGLDAYVGSYDNVLGRLLFFLPDGEAGALASTAFALVLWTIVASVLQVYVYRRGLRRWPADAATESGADPGDVRATGGRRPRFDPRAVVLAAVVAFGLLLASTSWALLAAVSAWLAVASLVARGDSSAVRAGLALAAFLAAGALVFGLVGGLGLDETLRRTLRAGLLVLVATWMRAAAGEDGMREVFRRALHRLRAIPGTRETASILDGLGSTSALAASGRRLLARLQDVPRDVLPIADAVLDWVVGEAGRHPPGTPPPQARLRARGPDGVLVALVALALPLALAG